MAVTWKNGTQPIGGVHRSIATLVTNLGNETIRRGYVPHKGWCWGFACRAITGTTDQPSLHSWGLAVDINAPTNPYGPTLVTDQPVWMNLLWESFGFRWGGTYPGNKDAMHREFVGSPTDARLMTAKSMLFMPKPPKPPINPPPKDPSMITMFTNPTAPIPFAAWVAAGANRRWVDSFEAQAWVKSGEVVHTIILDPKAAFWTLPPVGPVPHL